MGRTHNRVVVIDVETTGLQPGRHEVVQIGLVGLDPDTLENEWTYESLVAPQHPERADADAMAVHGIDEGRLRDAPPFADIADEVARMVEGVSLAGHNVWFDEAFLRAEVTRARGAPACRWHYRRLDTASMAYPMLRAGLCERLSLAALCRSLGVAHDKKHDALADALATAEVMRRLVRRAAA